MKVRYYGHVGQRSGYGRAAADMCMSLLAAGVELEISAPSTSEAGLALGAHHLPLAGCLRSEAQLGRCDVVIVHTLPHDCERVLAAAGLAVRNGDDLLVPVASSPRLIAYTTWEALSPPPTDTLRHLAIFGQVWVPSVANARAFSALNDPVGLGTKPVVRVVPHAFHEPSLPARRGTGQEVGRGPFRFYYLGAWNSRKNPQGVLRAYAHAFSAADDVELRFHCVGLPVEAFAASVAATGIAPKDLGRVRLHSDPVSDVSMTELHLMSDCYVTATRGEAWNLPAFDAALAGRNIICPGGLGSDDFLVDSTAVLYGGMAAPAAVDVEITGPVAGGGAPMRIHFAHGVTAKARWLEPDLIRLAEHMRNAYDFQKRDLHLKYDPVQRYGYAAVGKVAMTALSEVLA